MDARITLIAGALLMRLGLALYGSGSVRSKNAASFLGRHLLDWALCVMVFWLIGLSIAGQMHNGVAWIEPSLLLGSSLPGQIAMGLAMVSVIGAIVIGATAERSRLATILVLSVVTAALILPLGLHWSYFGWLTRLGFVDRGGAASIHVAGAVIAWVTLRFIGPREGKYPRDGSSTVVPGHNVNLLLAGAWLAVIGGALFICQDAADIANVLLAIAASVLAAAGYCMVRFGKIDLTMLAASAIAGMVSISAAGGQAPEYAAVIIGAVAGVIVAFSVVHIDLVQRLDDVTGALSVHGLAGAWGVLAAGLFRVNRSASVGQDLLAQGAGVAAIVLLAAVIAGATLLILSRFIKLRVRDDEEFDGLDLAEHDVACYPDFQQTTIKSYHLREM